MAKYNVDAAHSNVGFEVKHMMVSKVKGSFDKFDAQIEADDLADLTTAKVTFELDPASVNTRNEDRDNHLKSADFFNVEQHDKITFTSSTIEGAGQDYQMSGDLTIKDVTKPVTFDIEFGGQGVNPWGNKVYGFEAESKINREDFDLTWNTALETGGVLVGKEIKIKVELEINPAE